VNVCPMFERKCVFGCRSKLRRTAVPSYRGRRMAHASSGCVSRHSIPALDPSWLACVTSTVAYLGSSIWTIAGRLACSLSAPVCAWKIYLGPGEFVCVPANGCAQLQFEGASEERCRAVSDSLFFIIRTRVRVVYACGVRCP